MNAPESRHAATPEPFVSADAAADFLGVTRRFLLSLARKGIAGAYPLGTSSCRKLWRFRLSELTIAIDQKSRYDPGQGGPR